LRGGLSRAGDIVQKKGKRRRGERKRSRREKKNKFVLSKKGGGNGQTDAFPPRKLLGETSLEEKRRLQNGRGKKGG